MESTIELPKSQQIIIGQLKRRGPQSVKILANRLEITTMGIRQHLEELQQAGLITQTRQEKQTRGRPVRMWKLTKNGHARFPNTHEEVSVELITLVRQQMGEESLNQLIEARNQSIHQRYQEAMSETGEDLQSKLATLTRLRNDEGFMAETRLLPDGNWLLIENHCPVCAAARSCQQFCRSELTMFQQLLESHAVVERVDYLLAGARRCAYRVSHLDSRQN